MYHLEVDPDGVLWCPKHQRKAYSASCGICKEFAGILNGKAHCNHQDDDGDPHKAGESDATPLTLPTLPDEVQTKQKLKILSKHQVYVECPIPYYHGSAGVMECVACKHHRGLTFADALCAYRERGETTP